MNRILGACILLSLVADAGAYKAAAQVPTEKKDKEVEKPPLPQAKENAPKEDGRGKDGAFRDPTQPSEELKALLSKAGMVNLIEKSKGSDILLDIVDFQNVSLFDAMRNLSLKTGMRIVPSQDAAKTMVNFYLAKVRPEEVIETLGKANNLVSQPGTQSGVIFIVTQKEDADKKEKFLKGEEEKQQKLLKAAEAKKLAEEERQQKLLKAPVNVIEKSKVSDTLLEIVEFRNALLLDAMRNLSLKTGLRIVASQDAANAMVNLYLTKVTPDGVIETLAKANNLAYQPDSNSGVIMIVTQKEEAEFQKKRALIIQAEVERQERILKAEEEKQQQLVKAAEAKRLAEEEKQQKLLKDLEAKKLAAEAQQQKLLNAAEARKLAMEKSVLEIFSKTTIKGRVIGHDLTPGVLLDMNGKMRLVTKNSQYSLGGDVFFRVEEINATEVRIIAMPLNKTLVLN